MSQSTKHMGDAGRAAEQAIGTANGSLEKSVAAVAMALIAIAEEVVEAIRDARAEDAA